jgi:hypothetical protein
MTGAAQRDGPARRDALRPTPFGKCRRVFVAIGHAGPSLVSLSWVSTNPGAG